MSSEKQHYKKSTKSPIIFEELVAIKIHQDMKIGSIRDRHSMMTKILEYDREICKDKGISKSFERFTLSESTLHRFMKKYKIQTVTSFFNNLEEDLQYSKMPAGKFIKQVSCNNHDDYYNTDIDSTTTAPEDYDHNNNGKCNMVKKGTISDPLPTRLLSFEKFLEENKEEIETKYNAIIHYQGEKITELTKICSGLSNKIPPSSMVSLCSSAAAIEKEDVGENIIELELEQSRSFHLCLRAFIQVLSPIKKITEWIIENDFLIISSSSKKSQQGVVKEEDQIFQQLANTWFWDGILKYESVEENADKVRILQRFGYNIKALCKNHDQIFGTTFTVAANHGTNNLGFIPPPPQKILDMIIQQHYNHFLDFGELGPDGQMYDLPNLPFKKIQLVPPTNTKPFGKVSFCSWKPKVDNMDFFLSESGAEDDDEEDSASKSPPDILFAELNFDREKLTYVHFEWPHFEEDVILEGEKFYYPYQQKGVFQQIIHNQPRFDYQMIGVIWGRQFAGDWEGFRQDGLLPHLGAHKHPVTYIYATKRNTSCKNPKQGRWYLCLDDNYVSYFRPKELTNNFQDVLLYLDNNHRRTYRPQLLVFQKIFRPAQVQQDEESPISIHQYEPSLHKNMISSVVTVPPNNFDHEESSLFACCRRSRTTTTPAAVEKKRPKKKSSLSTAVLMRPNSQLTSKKKLAETIALICDHAVPISREAINNDERFFGFDKASDYQKGPSRFQIKQTEDQKRYYAATQLTNFKKNNY
jgi:hypothetical protein